MILTEFLEFAYRVLPACYWLTSRLCNFQMLNEILVKMYEVASQWEINFHGMASSRQTKQLCESMRLS